MESLNPALVAERECSLWVWLGLQGSQTATKGIHTGILDESLGAGQLQKEYKDKTPRSNLEV